MISASHSQSPPLCRAQSIMCKLSVPCALSPEISMPCNHEPTFLLRNLCRPLSNSHEPLVAGLHTTRMVLYSLNFVHSLSWRLSRTITLVALQSFALSTLSALSILPSQRRLLSDSQNLHLSKALLNSWRGKTLLRKKTGRRSSSSIWVKFIATKTWSKNHFSLILFHNISSHFFFLMIHNSKILFRKGFMVKTGRFTIRVFLD